MCITKGFYDHNIHISTSIFSRQSYIIFRNKHFIFVQHLYLQSLSHLAKQETNKFYGLTRETSEKNTELSPQKNFGPLYNKIACFFFVNWRSTPLRLYRFSLHRLNCQYQYHHWVISHGKEIASSIRISDPR